MYQKPFDAIAISQLPADSQKKDHLISKLELYSISINVCQLHLIVSVWSLYCQTPVKVQFLYRHPLLLSFTSSLLPYVIK